MEELLKLAKEDLETAQLLYKGKKYSNALYHYHQSVEKAGKYIGLSIGGISEAQLTDISHDPIKVFKLLFKYFDKQSDGLLPPVDPHLFTNAKQIIDLESEEDIVKSAWNMLTSISNEGKIINEEQFPSPFDAVVDYICKTIPDFNLGLDDELFKQYAAMRLKNQAVNTIIFINFGIKILQVLLINSLICSKFKPDQFRYPSDKLGNPVEYFNENNALIRDLHFFINSMNIPIEFALKINWREPYFNYLGTNNNQQYNNNKA
jgi:hypothetical protein